MSDYSGSGNGGSKTNSGKKTYSKEEVELRRMPDEVRQGYVTRVLGVDGEVVVDIRQHLETQKFTGWTKSGLRLNTVEQIDKLMEHLAEVKRDFFTKTAPASSSSK